MDEITDPAFNLSAFPTQVIILGDNLLCLLRQIGECSGDPARAELIARAKDDLRYLMDLAASVSLADGGAQ